MNNRGFVSAVGLRKISIGPGGRLRPTYVSAKLNPKVQIRVDRSIKGSFVSLNEMLGLDRSVV